MDSFSIADSLYAYTIVACTRSLTSSLQEQDKTNITFPVAIRMPTVVLPLILPLRFGMSSQAAMVGLDDLLGSMSINETPRNTRPPSNEVLTILRPIVPSENNHQTLRVSPTSPEGKVILFDNLGDNGTEVINWWLLSGYEGKKERKTLSILFRGGGLDPVCAKSGWSYDQNNNNALSPISCSNYTRKSMELCRAQCFELDTDEYCDGNVPGQFQACFAEMQLIAYLAEERRPDLFKSRTSPKTQRGEQEEGREEKKQEQQDVEDWFDDHVLIITNLPTHTPPYIHCEKFAEVIGRLLRTKIKLENRRELLNLSDSI